MRIGTVRCVLASLPGPHEYGAAAASSLLLFQAEARSSRVSERNRLNLPFRLTTQTRSGREMADERRERAAGMKPPASTIMSTRKAARPRQADGAQRRRSIRCREYSRSKRTQRASRNVPQQCLASSSLFSRLSWRVSTRKLAQCQTSRMRRCRQSLRSRRGTSQLASHRIARQLQRVRRNGSGNCMVLTRLVDQSIAAGAPIATWNRDRCKRLKTLTGWTPWCPVRFLRVVNGDLCRSSHSPACKTGNMIPEAAPTQSGHGDEARQWLRTFQQS